MYVYLLSGYRPDGSYCEKHILGVSEELDVQKAIDEIKRHDPFCKFDGEMFIFTPDYLWCVQGTFNGKYAEILIKNVHVL